MVNMLALVVNGVSFIAAVCFVIRPCMNTMYTYCKTRLYVFIANFVYLDRYSSTVVFVIERRAEGIVDSLELGLIVLIQKQHHFWLLSQTGFV